MEELKQLNKPQALEASMPPPPPMIILPEADWNTLLNQLDRLEAQAAAQESLLRALTRQVGLSPPGSRRRLWRGMWPKCGRS